jgi:hypothetical protein
MKEKPISHIEILLDPGWVMKCLMWMIAFLTLMHIIGQFSVYHLGVNQNSGFFKLLFVNVFNLDSERSIPTLFVVIEWLFCLTLLGLIAYYKKKEHAPYLYWLGLAIVFVFLTIDESVAIHEVMMIPIRETLHTTGVLYYAWVIPYSAGIIFFMLVYVKFVFSLPVRTRNLFITAGTIFVTSAIGIELIESWNTYTQGSSGPYYHYLFFVTVEEPLEMIGLAIFIYALIAYINTEMGQLQIQIGHAPEEKAVPPKTNRNPKKTKPSS